MRRRKESFLAWGYRTYPTGFPFAVAGATVAGVGLLFSFLGLLQLFMGDAAGPCFCLGAFILLLLFCPIIFVVRL
jgi:hypothetical protein